MARQFKFFMIPARNGLLPAGDFRLNAVSARFPRNLSGTAPFETVAEGVFDIRLCGLRVRIIVTGRTAEKPENAIWQLYSAVPDKVRYGAETYRWRQDDVSGVIGQVFNKYKTEGVTMPYTFEDFRRDYVLEHVHKLPPEDVLKKFSADDLLKRLFADERLKGLSAKDIASALRKQMSGLSPEEKKAFLDEFLKSE